MQNWQRRQASDVFDSYDKALQSCGSSYDDQYLADVVVAKTQVFRDELATNPELDGTALRTIAGLAFARPTEGQFRVLDFGGQAGYHYFIARASLPSTIALDWRVVETRCMATAAASQLTSTELAFFDSIERAVSDWKPDLVFASGVLHCVSDPLYGLEQLIQVGARTIFITRTALATEGPTRAIVYKSMLSSNGPGILPRHIRDEEVKYPAVFVPRARFEAILSSRYDISIRLREEVDVYTVGSTRVGMFGYVATAT
jgi:putative methyltransferase (TIGR04325 family)